LNNIPKFWDEVYVDQFISLYKLTEDIDKGSYEKNIEVMSILTDTMPDDDEWLDMDIEDLADSISSLKWISTTTPTLIFNKKINGLEIIDINKLSFGEFIDLDSLFGDNYYNNLTKIAAILYKKTKVDEWGNTLYEPYGKYDINKRAILFEEVYITEIYGILSYYLEFKKELFNIYELLFEPTFDDEENDDEEYDDEERDIIKQEEVAKKWSWENILYKLSEGDITKYDAITEMPVIFIFNQMSFLKDMKTD